MPESDPPSARAPVTGLGLRIGSLVFLATFLTAVAVSGIAIHATYRHLDERIARTYPAILEGSADRTVRWLDEARSDLTRLAARVDAKSEGALASWLEKSQPFDAVALTDAGGRVLAAAGAEGDTLPPAGTDPGVWTRGASVGITVAAGRGDGPTLRLHARIARGRLDALLGIDGLGPGGGVLLVGSHGQVLAAGAGVDPGAGGPQRVPIERLRGGGVTKYEASDGTRRLAALRAIAGTPLRLVVSEPYEEAFRPVFTVVTRVFVIDLLILLVFGTLAYKITSAIVRPVEALSHGARRISEGDLDVELVESARRDEIGILTRAFNDMTRRLLSHRAEIERANQKLLAQNEELQRANEVLEQLSITDGLTKLHNHRYFQDHLTREIKRVGRTGEALSMLICDIDDFKRLNDRLGHAAGDELLVGIARILEESIRDTDFLARYGGEEFVVLTPGTGLEGAVLLAEKVREEVAQASFLLGATNQLQKVTLSIGVAPFQGNRKSFFHEADQALYRAKAAGKNCVRAASPPGDDPLPEL